MSMIANFRMLSQAEIESLLADPESIEELVYVEDGVEDDTVQQLDIDKAWHGLHYLLCGTVDESALPLGFLLGGGVEVGDVDLGYGPGRILAPDDVHGIANALQAVTIADLRARFDAGVFTEREIYPAIWSEGDSVLDSFLLPHFEALRDFVADASRKGRGLLVYLN